MKVEDPSAQMVQWFYHKSKYLPKGDESSWKNYTILAARNATTKQTFIVMEKILMDTRSICARSVAISGHRILRSAPMNEQGITHLAQFAEKRCICTTIENTTPITRAGIRDAGIPYLFQSLPLFPHHPCPNCSARRISNGCAILSM